MDWVQDWLQTLPAWLRYYFMIGVILWVMFGISTVNKGGFRNKHKLNLISITLANIIGIVVTLIACVVGWLPMFAYFIIRGATREQK